MKPIKMFGFAGLAALLAMAFVGASSAIAGSTALCSADESPCKEANQITHVHEATLFGAKARLLASPEVKCDVLFLGDTFRWWVESGGVRVGETVGLEGAFSLLIVGNFTYSNCEGNCKVEEENGPTEIEVLREASELAKVTSGTGVGSGLVHLECPFGVDCYYVGEGLVGHGLGPLTSSELNGSVTLSGQKVTEENPSFFCPDSGKLDITTTPLSATYIST
jgi:hypothetical protein